MQNLEWSIKKNNQKHLMDKEIWEFEGDWYIAPKVHLTTCVNTEEMAKILLEHLNTKAELDRTEFDKLITLKVCGGYLDFPKPMIEDPEAAWNLFTNIISAYKRELQEQKEKVAELLEELRGEGW